VDRFYQVEEHLAPHQYRAAKQDFEYFIRRLDVSAAKPGSITCKSLTGRYCIASLLYFFIIKNDGCGILDRIGAQGTTASR
jgi:hypothetical protein